jgi:hypothetical protein
MSKGMRAVLVALSRLKHPVDARKEARTREQFWFRLP